MNNFTTAKELLDYLNEVAETEDLDDVIFKSRMLADAGINLSLYNRNNWYVYDSLTI